MKIPAPDSIDALNRDMAKKNLGGHWQLGVMRRIPRPRFSRICGNGAMFTRS